MTAPRLSIRCFGGVAIERDGVPIAGRSTQRRRLALVVLLAASPDRPVSRDRLIAYLWPEADADSARHLLSGAVYELRKVLGETAIVSRGDDLWLDPSVARTDIAEFEAAVASASWQTAVELYRGPFADGFHVTDTPEFERWVEATRHRYRRTFRQALEGLALEKQTAGDAAGAANTWLRLAADDPSDALVIMQAMRALEAAGNRVAALRQAGIFEAYVRAEFGAEPAPQVLALANSLRDVKAPAPPPTTSAASAAARPHSSIRPPAARVAVLIGGIILAVGLAATLSRFAARGSAATDSAAGASGAAPWARLTAEGVVASTHVDVLSKALSTALDGMELFRGARVDGRVLEATGRLRVHVTLSDPLGQRIGEASAEGVADRPFEIVDALAVGLVAARASGPSERLLRTAAQSTSSLDALKAYIAGEHDRRAGRFAAAADWFGKSVVADSTFALGYYRLSMMTLAADLPMAQATAADDRAQRHAARLPHRDRLLLRAYDAFRRGDSEIAEQVYRGLTGTYSDDVDAWRQLGETLFHYNPLRGRAIGEARAAFERVLSVEPKDWDALWHLAQIAANEGRRDEAVRSFDALLALGPGSPQSLELRTLRAFAARDSKAETALVAELSRADELVLHQIVWRTAVYLGDIHAAERVARLMVAANRPRYSRNIGHQDLAALHYARGQWRAATENVVAAGTTFRDYLGEVPLFRALFSAHAIPARPRPELQELRAALLESSDRAPKRSLRTVTMAALLDVALGDTIAARRRMQLERAASAQDRSAVRGAIALARGDAPAAIREIETSFGYMWFGLAVTSAEEARTLERFLYAEALRAAGRNREAIGWYAAFGEHAPHDLPFLAPSHWRRAELYELAGDRRRAAAHYARVAELWRDCDPELRALRDLARLRSEALMADAR